MVKLHRLKRVPKPLKRWVGNRRVYVGEFTPEFSEATIHSKIAGKRKRWYIIRLNHAFEVYDKKGRYYGTFTKSELFGARNVELEG